jgi:hypothetical protein
MNALLMSRRAAVATLAAAFAWPALARAEAAPASRPWFRSIEVDVRGDDAVADWVAQDLPAALRRSFGAHLAPGDRNAPILRARIDSVTLGASNSLSTKNGGASDDTMDFIEGAGVVVDANGREIASYPLLCSLRASTQMPDPAGVGARQRAMSLAQGFAQWLPGKMGL